MKYICRILENKELCKNIYEMLLESPEIAGAALPGQFLHLRINAVSDPLLRRPISISRVDKENNRISLIYQVVGKGTADMALIKPGDSIDVMGPLGKGFPVFPEKKCAVIGGGMGVAPLLELAAKLSACDAYLGFRSGGFKIDEYKAVCNELYLATEDGSLGEKGYVTELLKEIKKYEIVYTCGPKVMMKRVKELCERESVKCYVSIEERMGCGIGACLVCACKVKEGDTWHYKKACTDGPVFEAGEVDFND